MKRLNIHFPQYAFIRNIFRKIIVFLGFGYKNISIDTKSLDDIEVNLAKKWYTNELSYKAIEFLQRFDEINEKNYLHFNNYYDKKSTTIFFSIKEPLGCGAYGVVRLAMESKTKKIYALKILKKSSIRKSTNGFKSVQNEKIILMSCKHDNITRLYDCFQDKEKIYFQLEYLQMGDFFTLIRNKSELINQKGYAFSEENAKCYVGQIILAIEYLHSVDILHRDIKPENILVDCKGYLKLTDFGFAKKLEKSQTFTFLGTMEYMAPEIIYNWGYNKSAEWWAIGMLIMEVITGQPLIVGENHDEMVKRIKYENFLFPNYFSDNLKNLLNGLLEKDITRRLGNLKDKSEEIRRHQWFSNIRWRELYYQYLPAPVTPFCKDVKNLFQIKYNLATPIKRVAEYFDDDIHFDSF